jgi:phenylacetate-CoA ligase
MRPLLRRLAYDFVLRRDGLAGWNTHRRRFHTLAGSTAEEARLDALDSLRRLLAHAHATVPFYRDAWKAAGFEPSASTTFADLVRLPLITKDDIRYRKAEMVSSAYDPRHLQLDYTGGTTGTQTSFYRDRECTVARFGRQWGVLERAGYRPGDRRALIWGARADLPATTTAALKHRLRRYASSDEVLSCAVMSRSDLREYHRRLLGARPSVIYGYPNAIEQFAAFIRAERLTPISVRRIFCAAERLHERQRRLFEDAFGADVFNLYASREHGVAAFECARHDVFHVDTGSVYVEILRDGRPAAPGETGELVITDLLNYGMPLIRHATADLGVASAGPCACGSPFPTFAALEGRVADVVYRPDGSTVAGLILADLLADHPSIVEAQFVQHDRASLDVYLVMTSGEIADITTEVARQVRSLVGPELRLDIHRVRRIPRNPRSGKYQEVISRLPA